MQGAEKERMRCASMQKGTQSRIKVKIKDEDNQKGHERRRRRVGPARTCPGRTERRTRTNTLAGRRAGLPGRRSPSAPPYAANEKRRQHRLQCSGAEVRQEQTNGSHFTSLSGPSEIGPTSTWLTFDSEYRPRPVPPVRRWACLNGWNSSVRLSSSMPIPSSSTVTIRNKARGAGAG